MKSFGIRVGRNPVTGVFIRSCTDTGTTAPGIWDWFTRWFRSLRRRPVKLWAGAAVLSGGSTGRGSDFMFTYQLLADLSFSLAVG